MAREFNFSANREQSKTSLDSAEVQPKIEGRAFKDSGIEWIGQIPKEWEVCPHKHIMFKKKEIQEHYAGQDIISLTMNGVVVRDLDAGGKMPLSFDGYQIIYPNNLLLCLFDIDVTPRCVGLINNYGVTSPAYSQFVVKEKGYPPYYDYLLRYMDDHKCLLHLSKNLRSSLTETDFGQIKTCIPPYTEQQKIADYLDKVCGEVDEMVALQETMIEELKAYKQSVITEAVTKGLNPNAPMRDSGIDWIGKIPEGWKVCRIKNVASLFGRIGFRGYTSDDLNKDGIGAITLSPSNMKPMGMDYQHVTYLSWKKYEESPEIMIQNDDLLMVKTGSSYGKVSYVNNLPREATINPQILRIVPNILSKYLGYYMQTSLFLYQVEGGVVGGTIPTISQEKINNFYVVLPKENEQHAIASYLDTKCSEIDSLIALKQAKIEELKEYKKSVIYEYVTGKKEVV